MIQLTRSDVTSRDAQASSRGESTIGATDKLGLTLGVLVLLVLLLLLAWAWGSMIAYGKPSGPGEFGGLFGGASALFAGLAFVGVAGAFLLQRRDVELQRRVLTATQEQLEVSQRVHVEHLAYLKRVEQLRLTLELAERYSREAMVHARLSIATWKAIQLRKSQPINKGEPTVRHMADSSNEKSAVVGVRSFVDFVSDCDALASAKLLDHDLACRLFRRELIGLCHELETSPGASLKDLWDSWYSDVLPRVSGFRTYLQQASS